MTITRLGLIEQLLQLRGPSPEMDAQIVAWHGSMSVRPYPPASDFGPHNHWQFWSRDGEHFLGSEGRFPVQAVTSDMRVGLAMAHTYLTDLIGWQVSLLRGTGRAAIIRSDGSEVTCSANTPELALVGAVLLAMEDR